MKNLLSKHLLSSLITVFVLCFFQNIYADETNQSSTINSLIEDNSNESFLSPDVAFKLNLTAVDASNIKAAFTVAPGYYLYNKRIKFEIQQPDKGWLNCWKRNSCADCNSPALMAERRSLRSTVQLFSFHSVIFVAYLT